MKHERKLRVPDFVVIVGSILLALLLILGVHEVSHRRAKDLLCMSNLRQWTGIFQGYVERNDGKFISSHPWYWIEQLDEEHKDRSKMKIWFCPGADKPLLDENRNRVRESSVDSAWGIITGDEYGPTGMAGSYGLNGYALNTQPGYRFERGIDTTFNWATPNVEGSAHIPLFLDALRFDLWPRATEGPPEASEHDWNSNHMARCCIDRHGGVVNCLFMDWSVRKVGLKQFWTLKWHRQFDTAGPWTKAGGVQPEDWPQWMRGYKDY